MGLNYWHFSPERGTLGRKDPCLPRWPLMVHQHAPSSTTSTITRPSDVMDPRNSRNAIIAYLIRPKGQRHACCHY